MASATPARSPGHQSSKALEKGREEHAAASSDAIKAAPSLSRLRSGDIAQQLGGIDRLEIPVGPALRRPPEHSASHHNSLDEPSPLYYEPQGELRQEHQFHRSTATDFSIPHVVPGGSTDCQPANERPGESAKRTLAPPRPPPGTATPLAGTKRKSISEQGAPGPSEEASRKRQSVAMVAQVEGASPSVMGADETLETPRADMQRSAPNANPQSRRRGSKPTERPPEPIRTQSSSAMALPARKVFPIQIGDKLFRLSGASISSDAPSYFSQFFEEQLEQDGGAENVRTLYIDRDPATFEDISLHLQGYHIQPRDGTHFVKLFADAQFFSLPRLVQQLHAAPIYVRVGDTEFQIPRDLFNTPGDSPNYFTLGFAIFLTTPDEIFPGLNQRRLLRPPSILPPSVPNRSAKIFADLLHLLQGYPLEINSEEHRTALLKDARYFHFKGLEQRLIPHSVSYNLARGQQEIVVRLEDIRQSGVSFVPDGNAAASTSASASAPAASPGWIHYQRPYIDSEAYSLIMETAGEEDTLLSLAPSPSAPLPRFGRATFHRLTLSRIASLFSVIANKMNLSITQHLGPMTMDRGAGVAGLPVNPGDSGLSDDRVKVRLGPDAHVVLNGRSWPTRRGEDEGEVEALAEEWIVQKAQWRVRIQPVPGAAQAGKTGMEVILGAVKLEAYSAEAARNAGRPFLA